jgi:sulfide:quinone oxidoreductase
MPGNFPLAHVGPFKLLKETRTNHMGKLMFRWAYWNLLLKGKELPIGPEMSLKGKIIDEENSTFYVPDAEQLKKLSGG